MEDKLCRTCLKLTKNYESVMKSNVLNIIEECASVKMNSNINLPQVVCTPCFEAIQGMLTLKEKFKESETILNEYVQQECNIRWLSKKLGVNLKPSVLQEVKTETYDFLNDELDTKLDDYETFEGDCKAENEIKDNNNEENVPENVEKNNSLKKLIKKKEKLKKSTNKLTKTKSNQAFLIKFRASVVDGMTCLTCKKTYNRKDKLKRHMMAHKFDFRHFNCPENSCGREFNRLRALSDHVKRMHKFEKTLKCDICFMEFYLVAQLEKHKLCNHKVAASEQKDNGNASDLDNEALSTRLQRQKLRNGNQTTEKIVEENQLSENEMDYVYGDAESKCLRCPDCSVIVNGPKALKKHRLRHTEPKFECPLEICGLKYYEGYRLTEHLKLKHPAVTVNEPCRHCTKRFYTLELVNEHAQKKHSEKIEALCDTCGMYFKNIHKHMNLHKKESLCHICGKTYLFKSHLSKHTKSEIDDRTSESLKPKEKEDVKDRTCKYCGKEFNTKKNRQTHESVVHRGKMIICQICNVTIKRKSLSSHMIFKHDKGERYPCQICNQQCKTPRRFRNHMRIHTDERPFPCSFCDKSFRQVKTQINHMRLHTGEKPHGCKLCEKRFAQPNGLAAHMKTHAKYGAIINYSVKNKQGLPQNIINQVIMNQPT